MEFSTNSELTKTNKQTNPPETKPYVSTLFKVIAFFK